MAASPWKKRRRLENRRRGLRKIGGAARTLIFYRWCGVSQFWAHRFQEIIILMNTKDK